MKEIILTEDSIFLYDGYQPTKLITSGISLDRMNMNPIMLFNHNMDNVIGTWENIRVEDNKIIATPNFDDDDDSQKIAKKYKKGTLKSASVGIDVYETYYDDIENLLIITKAEMFEASIASVPQNPNAMQLSFSKMDQVKYLELSKKLELNKKVKLMKDETNNNEVIDTPVVDETPLNTELQTELEDAKKTIEEKELSINELNDNLNKLKSEFDALVNSMKEKNIELENSRKDNNSLEAKIKQYELIEKQNIINSAVQLGKITKDAAQKLLSKSIQDINDIIELIPAQSDNVSLTNNINLSRKSEQKSYSWYLKNDKQGLIKLEKENPELVKILQEEYLKNK